MFRGVEEWCKVVHAWALVELRWRRDVQASQDAGDLKMDDDVLAKLALWEGRAVTSDQWQVIVQPRPEGYWDPPSWRLLRQEALAPRRCPMGLEATPDFRSRHCGPQRQRYCAPLWTL